MKSVVDNWQQFAFFMYLAQHWNKVAASINGPLVLCDIATKAMADRIFKCAKKAPDYDFQLEDCKCPESLLPDVSCCRAAGWDYRQFTNKGRDKHMVMHQLHKVFSQFNGHLLYQAKHIVVNQDIFGGPSHTNGIYNAD